MGSIFQKRTHSLAENSVVNKSSHYYTKIYQGQLQLTFLWNYSTSLHLPSSLIFLNLYYHPMCSEVYHYSYYQWLHHFNNKIPNPWLLLASRKWMDTKFPLACKCFGADNTGFSLEMLFSHIHCSKSAWKKTIQWRPATRYYHHMWVVQLIHVTEGLPSIAYIRKIQF